MSAATKCDKCGSLFEPKQGSLTLGEVCVTTRKTTKDGSRIMDTWTDLDFCHDCSKPILGLIGPAMTGLAETLRVRKERKR